MTGDTSLGIGEPAGRPDTESHRLHHHQAAGEQPAPTAVVGLTARDEAPKRRSLAGRAGSAVLAAWGALTGVAPHVLHHVGPLAGAAFLAGAGGRALFAAIALVVSIPFLLRLYRRFSTWVAPAIALAVMAGAFSLSTFVIGPAISGERSEQPAVNQQIDEHGH